MVDYVFNESGFQAYNFAISNETSESTVSALYKFIYISSGSCRLLTEHGEICANKGQILFNPIETPCLIKYCNEENDKKCYGTVVCVRFFAGVNRWDYLPQVITPNQETLTALKEVPVDNYGPLPKDCGFMRRFFSFLEIVQSCMVKNSGKFTTIIEKAIKYMYDNLDCEVADVANHCNICESYLFRIFEKNVLCSPAKFKQRIRAERGEELLRGTDLTVDEIANQVGFNSTAHFRKVFESRFHLSPSEIRKKYKKN